MSVWTLRCRKVDHVQSTAFVCLLEDRATSSYLKLRKECLFACTICSYVLLLYDLMLGLILTRFSTKVLDAKSPPSWFVSNLAKPFQSCPVGQDKFSDIAACPSSNSGSSNSEVSEQTRGQPAKSDKAVVRTKQSEAKPGRRVGRAVLRPGLGPSSPPTPRTLQSATCGPEVSTF